MEIKNPWNQNASCNRIQLQSLESKQPPGGSSAYPLTSLQDLKSCAQNAGHLSHKTSKLEFTEIYASISWWIWCLQMSPLSRAQSINQISPLSGNCLFFGGETQPTLHHNSHNTTQHQKNPLHLQACSWRKIQALGRSRPWGWGPMTHGKIPMTW